MFLQMPALIVLYDTIKGLTNTIKLQTKFPATAVLPLKNAMAATGKSAAISRRTGQRAWSGLGRHTQDSVNTPELHAIDLRRSPVHPPTLDDVPPPGQHPGGDEVVRAEPGFEAADTPAHWYDYIPYFALVAIAVALQYFQMSQMTKRNKNAAQMNPQMQTMQKVMPLIFAYIYFLVPAGVVIYMIVSSAIRIGTQDFIFRYGIVKRPGEREIGGSGKKKPGAGGAPALDVGSEVLSGEKTAGSKTGGTRTEARRVQSRRFGANWWRGVEDRPAVGGAGHGRRCRDEREDERKIKRGQWNQPGWCRQHSPEGAPPVEVEENEKGSLTRGVG